MFQDQDKWERLVGVQEGAVAESGKHMGHNGDYGTGHAVVNLVKAFLVAPLELWTEAGVEKLGDDHDNLCGHVKMETRHVVMVQHGCAGEALFSPCFDPWSGAHARDLQLMNFRYQKNDLSALDL